MLAAPLTSGGSCSVCRHCGRLGGSGVKAGNTGGNGGGAGEESRTVASLGGGVGPREIARPRQERPVEIGRLHSELPGPRELESAPTT